MKQGGTVFGKKPLLFAKIILTGETPCVVPETSLTCHKIIITNRIANPAIHYNNLSLPVHWRNKINQIITLKKLLHKD